jgi:hypothetical protein
VVRREQLAFLGVAQDCRRGVREREVLPSRRSS